MKSLMYGLVLCFFLFAPNALAIDAYGKIDFKPTTDQNYPYKYQMIDGFGASYVSLLGNFFCLTQAEQNEILEDLFSEDNLGVNIIRLMANRAICPNAQNCGTVTLPRKPADVRFVELAKAINPDLKISASAWAPPEWMLDTWTTNGEYQILCMAKNNNGQCEDACGDDDDCVNEYAYWLYEYLDNYEDGDFFTGNPYSVPIEHFSLQNEPEWKGEYLGTPNDWTCYCDAPEYKDRFEAFADLFNKNSKVTEPEVIIAETTNNCRNHGDYGYQVLGYSNNALAFDTLIFGNHIYLGKYFNEVGPEECATSSANIFCCRPPIENGECEETKNSICNFCYPKGDPNIESWKTCSSNHYIEDPPINNKRCRVACEQQVGKWGTQNWTYSKLDTKEKTTRHARVWMTEICDLYNAIVDYDKTKSKDKYEGCEGCPAPLASMEENPAYWDYTWEFSQALNLAMHIHFTMVCEKASAFLFWGYIHDLFWLDEEAKFWNFCGSSIYAVGMPDSPGEDPYEYRRCEHNYQALKHFSHFIKEGFQRVDAVGGVDGENYEADHCDTYVDQQEVSELYISAYKKIENNVFKEAVIVLINNNWASKSIQLDLDDTYSVDPENMPFYVTQSYQQISPSWGITYWNEWQNPVTPDEYGIMTFSGQNAIKGRSITTLHWKSN